MRHWGGVCNCTKTFKQTHGNIFLKKVLQWKVDGFFSNEHKSNKMPIKGSTSFGKEKYDDFNLLGGMKS